MRIDHRRPDILVTEQFLHRANVIPRFEEMRCKGMPERFDIMLHLIDKH